MEVSSLYLNSQESLDRINAVCERYPYFEQLIDDHQHSVVFQKQILFNTFHILSNDSKDLILDSEKSLGRPLVYLIITLIQSNESIQKLNSFYRDDDHFLLLTSCFLAKKIVYAIYSQLKHANPLLMQENLLDLIHLDSTLLNVDLHSTIETIQSRAIIRFKQYNYVGNRFSLIIEQAIEYASSLNSILMEDGVAYVTTK